jgi:hypothetical protein
LKEYQESKQDLPYSLQSCSDFCQLNKTEKLALSLLVSTLAKPIQKTILPLKD